MQFCSLIFHPSSLPCRPRHLVSCPSLNWWYQQHQKPFAPLSTSIPHPITLKAYLFSLFRHPLYRERRCARNSCKSYTASSNVVRQVSCGKREAIIQSSRRRDVLRAANKLNCTAQSWEKTESALILQLVMQKTFGIFYPEPMWSPINPRLPEEKSLCDDSEDFHSS